MKKVEKPYKKLLGNRVYVTMNMPHYTIEMDENVKKKLIAEAAQKMERATVYDIGTIVTTVAIGDEVMVGKEGILRGDLINLSPNLTVMMINPLEIVHIW